MERWETNQSEEIRTATIDQYCETGSIDFEKAGLDPIEGMMIEMGFTRHVTSTILAPLGLSYADWNDCIDPKDLPAFRRAAVKGDWAVFHGHAQRVAQALRELDEAE